MWLNQMTIPKITEEFSIPRERIRAVSRSNPNGTTDWDYYYNNVAIARYDSSEQALTFNTGEAE